MHRPALLAATVALAVGAAFGLLMLGFATGELYLDDPDPDPPLTHGWLWMACAAGVVGLVLAIVGAIREDRLWMPGALLLGALTLLGPVLLAAA